MSVLHMIKLQVILKKLRALGVSDDRPLDSETLQHIIVILMY